APTMAGARRCYTRCTAYAYVLWRVQAAQCSRSVLLRHPVFAWGGVASFCKNGNTRCSPTLPELDGFLPAPACPDRTGSRRPLTTSFLEEMSGVACDA